MSSHLHEALVELFRQRPALAAELLTDAVGLELPAYQQANLDSSDLTQLLPTEYRADAVVRLTGPDGPVLTVVVEAQLGRDSGKRRSWPVYLATVHARMQCPAVLLVVCADDRIANWCATPIELGPGSVVTPLVLGPGQVPAVVDVAEASRRPELAVLSALAHAHHPDREKIFQTLLAGLRFTDHDHANLYADIVLAALPQAARHQMEEIMAIRTYEYRSEFARRYFYQGRAEGRAEGEARAVLAILAARGFEVPDEAHERIMDCTDLDQLEVWVRRAVTATTLDDLFDQLPS